MKKALTHKRVVSLLSYQPDTGEFRWLASRGRARLGHVAGNINRHGYRQIRIDGKTYEAHRLAWFFMRREWPSRHIDHINRSRDDNRANNLREANQADNNRNTSLCRRNTSGFKGVTRHQGRWRAEIGINGKKKFLGSFEAPEDAHAAYCVAAERYFGEFARFE